MWYDARHVAYEGRFDSVALASAQRNFSHAPGLYLTSQLSTAKYYAGISGYQGRGGGPGVLKITVDREAFLDLATAFGIQIEAPVPHPPLPGQTETVIPSGLIDAFNLTIKDIAVLP